MPVTAPLDPAMKRLHLSVGGGYEVLVGRRLLEHLQDLIASTGRFRQRCAVVTDSNVAPLHAFEMVARLQASGFAVTLITIPAGEASKSMEVATEICRRMLQAGLDRKSFLIALGGGVVGDVAGFAAAIFQRGIPYVQVPTTIVSQVDSSVGGKTGVNTPEGKNLLGAFHQPALVVADVETLGTLPGREFREGFAEIIKHAAIRDAALLSEVETTDWESVQAGDRAPLVSLISRNVAIKAAVVEDDELETKGIRALLNFGHTIGHGIEAAAGYGQLLHGEAISLGMVAALRISETHAGLDPGVTGRVVRILRNLRLPVRLNPTIPQEQILAALARDKKFEEGQIRFVLLRSLGDAFVSDAVPLESVTHAVARLTEEPPA